MLRKFTAEDPRGLIHEAFRMTLSDAEARTIFLDWALDWPVGTDTAAIVGLLHARYAQTHTDHPMLAVLAQGLAPSARRRGRRRSVERGKHTHP